MHVPDGVQETLDSSASPGTVGVGSIDHVAPFQRSDSASFAPDGSVLVPTATHAFEEEQETPVRTAFPGGSGVGCSVHVVPSQAIAKGFCCWELPTAVQLRSAGQDTASR